MVKVTQRYAWGGHICVEESPACSAHPVGDVVSVTSGRTVLVSVRSSYASPVRPGIVLGHYRGPRFVVLVGTEKLVCTKVVHGMKSIGRWCPEALGHVLYG